MFTQQQIEKKALSDADYVLISISVGLQESEWIDIHIPLKFGIPQNTGDTVGPGGIFRGIRTIPIMVDVMRDIKELSPNAVVLNYTNPQGTTMLSAIQAAPNIQSIGLCHELFRLGGKKFTKLLQNCGIELSAEKNVELLFGGINHFAFVTKFEYDGIDIYSQIRDNADYAYRTKKFGIPFNYYLLKQHGYFTYVEDRHVTEFLPRYYNYFNHWEKPFGITELRNVHHVNLERTLTYIFFKWLQKKRNWWILKLILRPWEGGEKALMMAKDRERDIPRHHVCNVINNGTIPSLPNNCIIEAPCYFKYGKYHPVKIGSLPKPINDWITIHAVNQQQVVNAALSGEPEDLLKALLTDPMCQFIEDQDKIESMMMHMLYYEKRWLPNFNDSVPLINDLKRSTYYIDKKELTSYKLARMEKFAPDPKLKDKAWPFVP
jgi:alpha-galactosidase